MQWDPKNPPDSFTHPQAPSTRRFLVSGRREEGRRERLRHEDREPQSKGRRSKDQKVRLGTLQWLH